MQTILITGTSSGFGELTARTLLQKGYTVAATMRHPETKNADAARRLNNVAGESRGTLHLFDLDVADESSVKQAVERVLAAVGRIDVVVNNAGYGVGGVMEAVTAEQLQRQLDVNVVGVHRVMRAVLPAMRQAGEGLIINISSIMGRITIPFATAYTASKFALEGLSESYRYDLAETGVDVVMVEPGGFGTSFLANMETGQDQSRLDGYMRAAAASEKMWQGMGENLDSENAPNPQDVADAVVRLIETAPGQRPLRTVVDPLMGGEAPERVNQTTAEIQNQLFDQLGLKAFLSVKG